MALEHCYYVYILASRMQGTFYIGVTNDLIRRVSEHRLGAVSGFTKAYSVHRLVWYEPHSDIRQAIRREKRLKKWRRDWKVRLIEQDNPQWMDLFPVIAGAAVSGSPGQAG